MTRLRSVNTDGLAGAIRFGCRTMRHALDYGAIAPRYYLCGHIHESPGIELFPSSRDLAARNDILTVVSNAATVQHIIRVDV